MIVEGDWIKAPETQAVCAALAKQGFQALFVGGCVRNALLGVAVSDIDIATDALPEDIMRAAKHAGLRAIPTGIDHGTITVVSGRIAHEITTFRADMETDGRHAKVAFSKDVRIDAARRDFTMNALYALADGTLLDPLDGLPDLKARRVRFIGDPTERIHEDYLRILRFFRFTAWYGDPVLGIDADGLAAVASNLAGLDGLSRERVGAELKKLLAAPDPAMSVAAMRSSGVLNRVLKGADDRALAPLIHHEQTHGIAPDPIRRLSVLADVKRVDSLRLSKAEIKRWTTLRAEIGSMRSAAHLGYRHGADMARATLMLRAAMFEQHVTQEQISDAEKGSIAVFPVKAADLPLLSGRILGDELRELEARWIASNFKLTRDELLA